MTEERYHVITQGELLPGFQADTVLPSLAKLFKTQQQAVQQILSPKPKFIAKNVDWEKAQQYQDKLASIGLVTYLDIALSAELYRKSLQPVTKSSVIQPVLHTVPSTTTEAKPTEQLSFKQIELCYSKLAPLLLHPAASETLFNEQGTPLFELRSYQHTINYKFMLIVGMISALFIQKYVSMLLVVNSTGIGVILFSICLFLGIAFFLPRIMMPNRLFSLNRPNESIYALCQQQTGFSPFVNYYDIYDHQDQLIGQITFSKLKSEFLCRSAEGVLLFSSEEEHDIDDFTKGVTEDLRDEIFNLYFMKYIKMLHRWIKKLQNRSQDNSPRYSRKNALLVRDGQGKKLAYFERGKVGVLELPTQMEPERETCLLVFMLVCAGIQ